MTNKEVIEELKYQIEELKIIQNDAKKSEYNISKFEKNRTIIECSNAIRKNMRMLKDLVSVENISNLLQIEIDKKKKEGEENNGK